MWTLSQNIWNFPFNVSGLQFAVGNKLKQIQPWIREGGLLCIIKCSCSLALLTLL